MNQDYRNLDLPETQELILRLSKEILRYNVILLKGPLGAGKTHLVKFLLQNLKVKDDISSPTYSIVNQYQTADSKPVYHFDLYRLNGFEELLDIGFEEYIEESNLVLIEWPDRFMEFFDQGLLIEIAYSDEKRNISFKSLN
ncbi:MAG: tRNA (adenosine(37)-N6)-threonylcarbamoyltransferase complex ATPase subunit type 1 TsaE [Flavobacteriales bacterium]|nr:tRNA (adenosine(37)-N6)-threonylcarbamoyltransferase complex ATPase subunit type 1 TsaE [Flavobacteriales bacterium]